MAYLNLTPAIDYSNEGKLEYLNSKDSEYKTIYGDYTRYGLAVVLTADRAPSTSKQFTDNNRVTWKLNRFTHNDFQYHYKDAPIKDPQEDILVISCDNLGYYTEEHNDIKSVNIPQWHLTQGTNSKGQTTVKFFINSESFEFSTINGIYFQLNSQFIYKISDYSVHMDDDKGDLAGFRFDNSDIHSKWFGERCFEGALKYNIPSAPKMYPQSYVSINKAKELMHGWDSKYVSVTEIGGPTGVLGFNPDYFIIGSSRNYRGDDNPDDYNALTIYTVSNQSLTWRDRFNTRYTWTYSDDGLDSPLQGDLAFGWSSYKYHQPNKPKNYVEVKFYFNGKMDEGATTYPISSWLTNVSINYNVQDNDPFLFQSDFMFGIYSDCNSNTKWLIGETAMAYTNITLGVNEFIKKATLKIRQRPAFINSAAIFTDYISPWVMVTINGKNIGKIPGMVSNTTMSFTLPYQHYLQRDTRYKSWPYLHFIKDPE